MVGKNQTGPDFQTLFSGGQDTISLQCASLQADTIHTLMLVKKHLHLAHVKAKAALRS